jgi:hypothetical protein
MMIRFSIIAVLLISAARPGYAQSAFDKLSPSAREEILKLTPAELAEIAGRPRGAGTETDGNDFLCTRWGCVGGTLRLAADTWRSSADGDWTQNNGFLAGLDAAAPVPFLEEYGVGAQIALSDAYYDFDGRASSPDQSLQTQQFYSFGLFRRPKSSGPWQSRWGLGAAYDFEVNHAAGTRADAYTLRQWRMKTSFDVTAAQEIGAWFAAFQNTTYVPALQYLGPNIIDSYRTADQLNFFYKYNFLRGSFLSVHVGPGVGGSILPNGPAIHNSVSPNKLANHPYMFTLGADAAAPLSDHFAIYGGWAYAQPSIASTPAPAAAAVEAFSLQSGVRFYWGGNARAREDAGKHWMPYLPDANNANMMTQSHSLD